MILLRHCPHCPGGGKSLCPKCPVEAPTQVAKIGALCAKCEKPQWRGQIRERAIGKKLLEWSAASLILPFTSANKTLVGSGLPYRVDFGYDLPGHFVGVEIDENQHSLRGYPPRCELVRMYRIAIALGKSAVFVRYNPDAFKIGDVTERVPKAKREALMLSVLQENLQTTPTAFITLVYICYSQPTMQMHGQQRAYVTTQPFYTEVDFEVYVGSVYPNDCATTPSGMPWYARP